MTSPKSSSLNRSYCHAGGSEPLLGATIPDHFASIVERFREREAVVCRHQARRLTYGELANEVDKVARSLIALGFGKGQRIGVWSTDHIEWLFVQLATARIGAILVNINPASQTRELIHALSLAEVQCLFVIPAFSHSDYVARLLEAISELATSGPKISSKALAHLRSVIIWDPLQPMQTKRPYSGFTVWQEFLAAGSDVPADILNDLSAELDCDDPINIQFTSGTTGFPKAVVLSHHNILNNAYAAARIMNFTEQDKLCVPVPFYHCFGMVLANLLCLSVGACIVIPSEHFGALAVLETIAAERCTAVHGVPSMFIAELEHPRFAEFDLTTLRTGIMAGAPCPEPLMKRVIEDMHCANILIGYGETEASPLTHLTQPEDSILRRTQTVGRNLPHQEVKIIDTDNSRTVPIGETGEICFRGYHVMRGYYGDDDETNKAIDDAGWLHSGDLGSMDADGYVRITGRLKEMIIRGGENIYPAEIEAWLFKHPNIAQAAVFGVPDPSLGECVHAWIQLHDGELISVDDISAYCHQGLAHFKVPETIRFVDKFPMTITGKIQKFRMREITMAEAPS